MDRAGARKPPPRVSRPHFHTTSRSSGRRSPGRHRPTDEIPTSTTVTLTGMTPRVGPAAGSAPACPTGELPALRSTARAYGERGGGPGWRDEREMHPASARRRPASARRSCRQPAGAATRTPTHTRAHAHPLFRRERARRAGAGQLRRRRSTPAGRRLPLAIRVSRLKRPAARILSESPVSPRLAAARRRSGSRQARRAVHERAIEAILRARDAAAAAISRDKPRKVGRSGSRQARRAVHARAIEAILRARDAAAAAISRDKPRKAISRDK